MGRTEAARKLNILAELIKDADVDVTALLPMISDFFFELDVSLTQLERRSKDATKIRKRLKE